MFNAIVKPTVMARNIFSECLQDAKRDNKHGHYVSYFRPEQLDALGAQLFLEPDGLAGFAITANNELIAAFKHPDLKEPNILAKIMPIAKAYGARRLECFEGFLSDQYSRHGFRVLERFEWDNEQAPKDWPETAEKPNYLSMSV